MNDTNRGWLRLHADNGGSKVAAERAAAISDLIGSNPKFLAAVEQLGIMASVDCAVHPVRRSSEQVMKTLCPQRTRGALR